MQHTHLIIYIYEEKNINENLHVSTDFIIICYSIRVNNNTVIIDV